jgi:DNA-binding CsgD family transcriptional regulator
MGLPEILFLVARDLEIRYASAAAESYFKRTFPLSVAKGRLTVLDQDLKSRLVPALRSACGPGREADCRVAPRPFIDWRDPGTGAVHAFRITSMLLPSDDPFRPEWVAGAFVTAPCIRVDPAGLYAARHALSRTEHRLLALLVAGYDLNAAALTLGQKISTTRTILKKIFLKTDTHRQADLIRKVLAPHAAPDHAHTSYGSGGRPETIG